MWPRPHLHLIWAAMGLLLLTRGAAVAGGFEDDLLAQINRYRAEQGLEQLVMRPELVTLAREHSRAMQRRGRLSHDGFEARFKKAAKHGIRGCVENVGWNYPTATGQFEGWQSSPGHDRNQLDPKITTAGIARSGAYVTFFACY